MKQDLVNYLVIRYPRLIDLLALCLTGRGLLLGFVVGFFSTTAKLEILEILDLRVKKVLSGHKL